MEKRQNDHSDYANFIDQPILLDENFANRIVSEFGNNTAPIRRFAQRLPRKPRSWIRAEAKCDEFCAIY